MTLTWLGVGVHVGPPSRLRREQMLDFPSLQRKKVAVLEKLFLHQGSAIVPCKKRAVGNQLHST